MGGIVSISGSGLNVGGAVPGIVFPLPLPPSLPHTPETFAGLHFVAFACLMLHRLVTVMAQRP